MLIGSSGRCGLASSRPKIETILTHQFQYTLYTMTRRQQNVKDILTAKSILGKSTHYHYNIDITQRGQRPIWYNVQLNDF